MSGIRLYGHHIPFLQGKVVDVVIIPFPCILKLNLHQISGIVIAWDICQIIIHVELCIMTYVTTFSTEAVSSASTPIFAFHIYYCLTRIIILRANTKNTILGFTFCSISLCACDISSMIPITLRSLIKGAKRSLNCFSSRV